MISEAIKKTTSLDMLSILTANNDENKIMQHIIVILTLEEPNHGGYNPITYQRMFYRARSH